MSTNMNADWSMCLTFLLTEIYYKRVRGCYGLNCVPLKKKDILKSSPLGPQSMILFGDRVITDVIS